MFAQKPTTYHNPSQRQKNSNTGFHSAHNRQQTTILQLRQDDQFQRAGIILRGGGRLCAAAACAVHVRVRK